MSFLKKRKPDHSGVNRLPKQGTPPTILQLQRMLQEATELSGRTCQMTFGDPPEEYSLAVFKDRRKDEVHWAFYHGDGEASMMVWDQLTNDPGFIHQLITAQFPGFDLKQVALRTSQANESDQQNPTIFSPGLREQQSTTAQVKAKPTFEGDLKNIQIPNVLQSIAMSRGTGRLEIDNVTDSALIYIADGAPIHCVSRGLEGEASLIELIGWEEGEFRFYPGSQHEQKTIKRRLETLIMEGTTIDDQFQALKKLGAKDSAFLSRKHSALSEREFENILKKGNGTDIELSKRVYLRIDGRTRLIDLVRRFNLPKLQWVPLIFNLATCNLIDFNDLQPGASHEAEPEPNIDWSQAVAAERLLTKSETGIYTYSAFLFFLNDELWRWKRFGRPFSVIILELSFAPLNSPAPAEPLTIAAVREIAERVEKLKRKTDIFTHHETSGFALLLLETDQRAANAFARRLVLGISKNPLNSGVCLEVSPGASPRHVIARAGVACIPDDCTSLGAVLARARPTG